MSDLTNYRQDLAVLDPAGGVRNPRTPAPAGGPAMSSNATSSPAIPGSFPFPGANNTPPPGGPTSFYNDSSDGASVSSQVSPSFKAAPNRTGTGQHLSATDSPDPYEERRPSFASNTTLSSQGSKNSMARGGLRKLQGFFGEEFPGSDNSSPGPAVPPKDSKDNKDNNKNKDKDNRDNMNNRDKGNGDRSFSHSRVQRGRNHSNATDYTRDASPSSSRPRTPVPGPDVVPFLYQEADVRPVLTPSQSAITPWDHAGLTSFTTGHCAVRRSPRSEHTGWQR